MKTRLKAYALIICVAASLSGCGQSCFKSDDIVTSQISIGDPSSPDISISKFPVVPTNKAAGCQAMGLVRVDLLINPYGYVQDVTFLDPWPNECANQYVRRMKFAKLIETPLTGPLEHFRVEVHNNRITTSQCIRITQ